MVDGARAMKHITKEGMEAKSRTFDRIKNSEPIPKKKLTKAQIADLKRINEELQEEFKIKKHCKNCKHYKEPYCHREKLEIEVNPYNNIPNSYEILDTKSNMLGICQYFVMKDDIDEFKSAANK